MSHMITDFAEYPTKDVFNQNMRTFSPFVVRRAQRLNPQLVVLLENCEEVVDVSCIDKASGISEYKGNLTDREILYMELQKFVEGFLARRERREHWLFDTDLNLYLSQLQIFSGDEKITVPGSLSALMSKIEIPELLATESLSQVNLWMNIDPSVSALHYDGNHNLLAVLCGCKSVTLVSPMYTALLCPGAAYSSTEANHANIPIETEMYLEQENIPVQTIELREGDVLFIPEGWWHHVKSTECTIAVNFWFKSTIRTLMEQDHMLPYLLRSTALELTEKNVVATTARACSSCIYSSSSNFEQHINLMMTSLTVSDHNKALKLNIERAFLECTLDQMYDYWIPFGDTSQSSLHAVLLSLEPESAYKLLAIWDGADNEWAVDRCRDFFARIFGQSEITAKAIRNFLVQQSTMHLSKTSMKIFNSLKLLDSM